MDTNSSFDEDTEQHHYARPVDLRTLHSLSDGTYGQHVFEVGRDQLFYTIRGQGSPNQPTTGILNLATLNRMLLHYMHFDLVRKVNKLYTVIEENIPAGTGGYLADAEASSPSAQAVPPAWQANFSRIGSPPPVRPDMTDEGSTVLAGGAPPIEAVTLEAEAVGNQRTSEAQAGSGPQDVSRNVEPDPVAEVGEPPTSAAPVIPRLSDERHHQEVQVAATEDELDAPGALSIAPKPAVRATKTVDAQRDEVLEISKSLDEYCKAVRNMDYMQSCASQGLFHDPFKINADWSLQRDALRANGFLGSRLKDGKYLPFCIDHANPRLIGDSRSWTIKNLNQQQTLTRTVYALAGGIALIAPMLFMVYVPGRTASVSTTCAFVTFALSIALTSNLKPHEVLAVTSAYAAILVVFVGLRVESIS